MTYGSNDYLKGHQTQKRCGLCEHNPILLPSGSCLDCKTVNPPLFRGSTQPTESEVIAQRRPRQEMEAPVFSESMRAPFAGEASAGDSRGIALASAPVTGMAPWYGRSHPCRPSRCPRTSQTPRGGAVSADRRASMAVIARECSCAVTGCRCC